MLRTALLVALLGLNTYAQTTLPAAAPPYFRVQYAPSTKPGELVYGVSYTIWIPPGLKTVRGIIVHQHGCGVGACKAGQTAAFDLHWQALAAQHDCALMGPSYEQPEGADCSLWCDPRNGSGKKFLQAIKDLAMTSGHPELANAPWALWGHSGGAKWAGTMLALHPEKCVAVWLRSGGPPVGARKDPKLPELEFPQAAYAVPVMINQGTREGVTEKDPRFGKVWEGSKPFFLDFRSKGGLIGVAIDPGSSHDCGNTRYLAIPWLDECLRARLPDKPKEPLRAMPTQAAYLAPLLEDNAVPAAQYSGDVKESVWLPSARVAALYAQYIRDGNVVDDTAPPAPTNLRLSGNDLIWEAAADLESGIGSFVIERDGQAVASVPEKPAGRIGRPIFQRNSYSDTPEQPLAEMRYAIPHQEAGQNHAWQVISVNSVGLKSKPSAAALSGGGK